MQADVEIKESETVSYKASVNRSVNTAVTDWLTAVIDAVIDSIEWESELESGFCAKKYLWKVTENWSEKKSFSYMKTD